MRNLKLFSGKGSKIKVASLIVLLCTSILVFSSSLSSVYGESQTAVHGKVTDGAGVGLENAQVTLQTPSGAAIMTTVTNTEGDFVIANADYGTYKLHISRVGYIAVVKTIEVATAVQHLGSIALPSALGLSASTLSLVAVPGDRVLIPFVASYSGDGVEVVDFVVSAPVELSARVLQSNFEVAQVAIASGQSISLQLQLDVPSSLSQDVNYNLSLIAHGTTSSSINFTVMVKTQPDPYSSALGLSASTLSLVAVPGDRVLIPFVASYSGDGVEVVDFVVSAPVELSARVLQSNFEVAQVAIASGQSISLQLELSIPSTVLEEKNYPISLTAIGANRASLNFSVIVHNPFSDPVYVSGRVTDENGNGLSTVTVGSFSSKGDLIQSVQSSSDGTFSFELPSFNTYSLHFSKAGYVTVTKSVSLNSTGNVTIADVSLPKTLWLTSSILGTTASPGSKLALPFTVSNVGTGIEPVGFAVQTPSGWSGKVLDNSDHEIKNTALSPSSNVNLQLDVAVPLGSSGTYTLTLSAIGEATTTLTFTVTVELPSTSILSCQYLGKLSTPGETVKFQATLTNPFSVKVPFTVTAISQSENWTAFIRTTSGDYITGLLLEPNQAADLVVEVKSPLNATTGLTYTFALTAQTAETSGEHITDSLPLTVALTETPNEIILTSKLPEVAVEAGNSVVYPLSVSNLGTTDRLLFLSVDSPPNWKAVFRLGDVEVTRLFLYASNTSEFSLQVTPPSTVNLDTYLLPVQIKSEGGIVLGETNLTTTVIGSYRVDLSLSTYLLSATSGETASFTATVTNVGYTPLTDVVVNVTLPDGWSYTVTPSQVDVVRARDAATFNVGITAPENAVAGDYMVSVKGDSIEMGSNPGQVRVTVSASTSWGLIGVGVAGLFITILVVVFWKFKRR
ncbi:MAG: carboxypeptidase regulatory-like domain-containing protein [Candidatus Bathyarchaeia archaeon]|jgi:uncharacterized repeat protein (TIGR01451 family)